MYQPINASKPASKIMSAIGEIIFYSGNKSPSGTCTDVACNVSCNIPTNTKRDVACYVSITCTHHRPQKKGLPEGRPLI
jgi:hypothetical protein